MSLREPRRGKLRAIARAFLVAVTCSVLMTVTSKRVKPQRGCNCGTSGAQDPPVSLKFHIH